MVVYSENEVFNSGAFNYLRYIRFHQTSENRKFIVLSIHYNLAVPAKTQNFAINVEGVSSRSSESNGGSPGTGGGNNGGGNNGGGGCIGKGFELW